MPNPKSGGPLFPPAAAPGTPAPAADNSNIDPGLAEFMKQNPHIDPVLAPTLYEYRKSRGVPAVRVTQPPPPAQLPDFGANFADYARNRQK